MNINLNISYGIALLAGLLSAVSPCVLPILPIVISRSLITNRYGPLWLVGGLITGFATVGSILGFTAGWITDAIGLIRQFALSTFVILGIVAIFPSLSERIFPKFQWQSRWRFPFDRAGEFGLGIQLGLLWTPCAGVVLSTILVLAATERDLARTFILLLFYGIGASIPLLALAYSGRYATKYLLRLRPHSRSLQRIGGFGLISTTIAIFLGLDVKFQLWISNFFPSPNL